MQHRAPVQLVLLEACDNGDLQPTCGRLQTSRLYSGCSLGGSGRSQHTDSLLRPRQHSPFAPGCSRAHRAVSCVCSHPALGTLVTHCRVSIGSTPAVHSSIGFAASLSSSCQWFTCGVLGAPGFQLRGSRGFYRHTQQQPRGILSQNIPPPRLLP